MQNQDSAPLLQVPITPAEFCPPGTWSEVFNQWTQQVLSGSIINVPGLGLVTPQEIIQINATLVSQQNQINLLNKAYRSGDLTFSTGDNNIVINFSENMPNVSYDIGVNFIDTGGVASAAFSWAIVAGTKTVSGVNLRAYDIPASVTTGTYWVRQR